MLALLVGVQMSVGYIDTGTIPKFSNCQQEGIVWFKACELWQDKSYTPKARRYYFFRLGTRRTCRSRWNCRKSGEQKDIYNRGEVGRRYV